MEKTKTNKYLELKEKNQKELNSFPMKFAFSNQQFKESMQELGLEPTDTDKIYKYGDTGGFYLKSDSKRLFEMIERHNAAMENAIKEDTTGDGFIFDMFDYELANHEYNYTRSIESTLDALCLTEEEINNNPALLNGLNKARKSQQKQDCF